MIIPTFPIVELIDRYLIAELKFEKTNQNIIELDYYKKQVQQIDIDLVKSLMEELKNIHSNIWNLEKELKSGFEQDLSLEEIGRRALLIRNENNKRLKIKNTLAEKLGCDVREIKHDHLSE
jgi:hypothetical protein